MASTAPFEIVFASTDQDAIEIHGFLCIVAQPVLVVPIDAQDSMEEIQRVIKQEAAIMARLNGHLIGTIGLISVPWWYNREFGFMADRWFFVLPQFHHMGVGARLEAEAKLIADDAGMQLLIMGHLKRRQNGVIFTRPKLYNPRAN